MNAAPNRLPLVRQQFGELLLSQGSTRISVSIGDQEFLFTVEVNDTWGNVTSENRDAGAWRFSIYNIAINSSSERIVRHSSWDPGRSGWRGMA